jgi:phosphinothricin acetyltransferase
MIRNADVRDAAQICEIYNHYIKNTCITFEEEAVSLPEMAGRIAETMKNFPWLVWEEDSRVLGYAYAHQWRTRRSYRFTAESSIYLAETATGRGIGSVLYGALLDILFGQKSMHSVVAGIALPNQSSVALHEKFGFRQAASFREVGFKFGKWIDVGYWELLARK